MNTNKLVTLTLGIAMTMNGFGIGLTVAMTLETIAYNDSYLFDLLINHLQWTYSRFA